MKFTYTNQILNRLEQLYREVTQANIIDYQDRLQAFKEYCEQTPVIANCLALLPDTTIDIFDTNWIQREGTWPNNDGGYAVRWNAIKQMVVDPRGAEKASMPLIVKNFVNDHNSAFLEITRLFVNPIFNYLTDHIRASSAMLYLLLRYKRWAEWFMVGMLCDMYSQASKTGHGEDALDENLRHFLFENGIDFPFSQPASPGGKVDIIAGLETDDPLVLEVKIWDSDKKYGEDRVRDGLRQAMDYADKYGKDRGYVVVFNLDQEPLEFESPDDSDEWPARLDHGGKTYYFITVNIGEQTKPVSQRSKGKPVKTNIVKLDELVA